MPTVYSFKDYDKHLCLKPPFEFWLVTAFFLRPFILKISTLQMGKGGIRTKDVSLLYDIAYPDNFSFFLAILSAVPVILLLVSFAKRKPDASGLIRKIWHNGVVLMALAAILNILVLFLPVVLGKSHSIHLLGWVQLGVIALIFFYLFTSQRLRDAFADFQQEADAGKSKGRKT